ncbi:ATP synthase F0 subcomplex B subunit [Mucilaginibacter mallensis]|uniref:ATP synthase subunit b n=1 Tax=Mucilaginibacter mallensis TaxID=652787 RepID=A0A1H1R6T6_MUCMA|nr:MULTISPECIES: F0F1 ATP synthase subunit B [Mucilaginibacter]MBB6140518.1 F-type H+-transporting ATPase subunit b [Mucilaginibacter sp. X5P1]SDS31325.1 ATP synthase F0 subcomplex B subunit [Mucilaginibacter mallensis]
MELVTPELGLVFWTTISFLIFLFLLRKFAWKPILGAINDRERSIEDSLAKADAAKFEMERLSEEIEASLKQARIERDDILSEARKVKEKIIAESKDAAQAEGAKMIEKARIEITSLKAIAMADVKNQVASLSLEIAEKVLRKQFEDSKKQDELVTELLKEVKI